MINQISIIGKGRVGTALFRAISNAGLSNPEFLGKGERPRAEAELIIICTPDDEIQRVVSFLESYSSTTPKSVVHTSGTVPVEILNTLRNEAVTVGAFHPNQAVSTKTQHFEGTVFDVCGDAVAKQRLTFLATQLGANSIHVTEVQKRKLHLAATISSNYLVTLMHIAQEIAGDEAISSSTIQQTLLPLMKSTLQNLEELPPEKALTGPISRRDTETIRTHLNQLTDQKELLMLYKKLGLKTFELIDQKGSEKALTLRKLLSE